MSEVIKREANGITLLHILRDGEPICPKCQGEIAVQKYGPGDTSAGCDTSVTYCIECDWHGEPE